MLNRQWAVFILIVGLFILPIVIMASALPVHADVVNFALGLKGQYVTLTRTLKLERQIPGGSESRRIEAPRSDPAWMPAVVLNAAYEHLFWGASYSATSVVDSEGPSSFNNPRFVKDVSVSVSELDVAVGYTIETWISPYVGYVRHHQRTDQRCAGCIGTVDIWGAGVGLLVDYPLPGLRWSAYLNTAWIRGFSLEGGLSYAGIRWPLVGVVGYAYHRIDYPSDTVSCRQPGFTCFREHDVFAGPTATIYYTF